MDFSLCLAVIAILSNWAQFLFNWRRNTAPVKARAHTGTRLAIFGNRWLYVALTIPVLAWLPYFLQPRIPEVNSKGKTLVVTHKYFRNEKVPLDGYRYEDCTFRNVTFVYNGTTTVQIVRAVLISPIGFHTDSSVVLGTIAALKGIGLIKPGIPLLKEHENIPFPNVEEPTFMPRPQR